MAHAPIPYYPFAVVLNIANNFSYKKQLQPPISGFKSVKIYGPQDVLLTTNFTRPSYLLDSETVGQSVSGLVVVGYRQIEYEIYEQSIHYIEISMYKNTYPASDSIPLMLLFLP